MTLRGYDSFVRPNQNGWGTATNGVAYTVVRGTGSSYHIASDEGTISGITSETAAYVGLGNKTSANFGVLVRCSRALNTNSSMAIIARASVASNILTGYKVRLKANNLDLTTEIGGNTTVIATTPYVVTPGQFDNIHLQIIGNQIWANAWADGTDEPDPWMLGPITDNSITGTGQCGLLATLQPNDTGSFDTFSWDDLTLPASRLPDTPYGYTLEARTPVNPVAFVDVVADHFTWVRPQTNWRSMEKTDDGSRGSTLSSLIDWSAMDANVQEANSAGLNLCMTIQNPPTWHCSQIISPANANPINIPLVPDTIAFMTAVVTRYNGRTINPVTGNPYGTVQAVMFNEDWDAFAAGWPGNGNPGYIGRVPTTLPTILQTMYPIVKAQLPTCRVGCASLLGNRTDVAHITAWVTALFQAWNGAVYCDFLDYHFYNCSGTPTQFNPSTNDPPLAARINAIKSVCAAFGHPQMDLWNTEMGWQQGTIPPAKCDVTLQQQSDYLLEAFEIAFNLGVSHIFVWTIGSKDNNSLVQGFGSNRFYAPAYFALQNFALLHPQFPTPIVRINAPIRTGHIAARTENSGDAQ